MGFTTKSRADIEQLQQKWLKDNSFNLEKTEGFEQHYDELLHFRLAHEGKAHQFYDKAALTQGLEEGRGINEINEALSINNLSLAYHLFYFQKRLDTQGKALNLAVNILLEMSASLSG